MKLYIENGVLMRAEPERDETVAVIPEGVTALADGAFSSWEELRSITIPGSIREGNPRAFAGCRNLREATLPFGWEMRDFFDLALMGVSRFTVRGQGGEEGWVGADGWRPRGSGDTAYGYTMAFRGPKRAIVRLTEAILERAGDKDAGGCLATLELFEGSGLPIAGRKKLSANFAELGEDELAWFISGGGFLDDALNGLPEVVRTHFLWLLTREPELEGCIRAADDGQNEYPCSEEFWFYTPAGSEEVREGTIQVLEFCQSEQGEEEDACEEEDEEACGDEDCGDEDWEDEDWDDWGGVSAASMRQEDIEAQFPGALGQSYAYLCALLGDRNQESGQPDLLTDESPVLDEYRRRLREKRRK